MARHALYIGRGFLQSIARQFHPSIIDYAKYWTGLLFGLKAEWASYFAWKQNKPLIMFGTGLLICLKKEQALIRGGD